MWLIYLRFEDGKETKTYHVTADNKIEAEKILALAEKRGLTSTSKLVEYANFYSQRMIKPKHVPNFHFYKDSDFTSRWEKVEES
jgi:hypothetical protein